MLTHTAGTLCNTLVIVMALLAFHVLVGVGTAFAVPVRVRRGPAPPKSVTSIVGVARYIMVASVSVPRDGPGA